MNRVQSITVKDGSLTVAHEEELLLYGTVRAKQKSGAYLFIPDGAAQVDGASSRRAAARGGQAESG